MNEFKKWFKEMAEDCKEGHIEAGMGMTALLMLSPLILIMYLLTRFYGFIFAHKSVGEKKHGR